MKLGNVSKIVIARQFGNRQMSVTETERPEVFWVDATSNHVVDAMNGKDVESKAKRYRDPTLGDLRNGPIDCEVRDCDDHDWKSGILVDIHDTVSSRFRVKTNICGIPSHFNQCRIEPIEPVKKPIEPVEGAAHYPKIGDTIFLPEMGRLKVLARGVEVC